MPVTTIQFRRGTAAEWAAANPVLAAGEKGFEHDTGKFKVGNGSAAWNALPYFSPVDLDAILGAILSGQAGQATAAGQATSNITLASVLSELQATSKGTAPSPVTVRGIGLPPLYLDLTVTGTSYAEFTVFGGRLEFQNVFPAAGNAVGGGRKVTITEVAVSLGAALPLQLILCPRPPTTNPLNGQLLTYERSRMLAARPLSLRRVATATWTAYLDNPIMVTQSTAVDNSSASLFAFLQLGEGGGAHAGTAASIRIDGFID